MYTGKWGRHKFQYMTCSCKQSTSIELIRITDSIQKYFHTISLSTCVRNSMYCFFFFVFFFSMYCFFFFCFFFLSFFFIWNVYCKFCYIRYHTWYNELCSQQSICFCIFFYLLIFVFVLTQNFIKIYQMLIL